MTYHMATKCLQPYKRPLRSTLHLKCEKALCKIIAESYTNRMFYYLDNCLERERELWCLTQYFSYIMAVSFIGEGKPDKSQVTDKLYQIKLYQVHLALRGNRTYDVRGDNH